MDTASVGTGAAMNVPDELVYPMEEHSESFVGHTLLGERTLADSTVAFVGLARNCAEQLDDNLARLGLLAENCAGWFLHVETNDNEDDTAGVLERFCEAYPPHGSYRNQTLNRRQFSAEFAGPRTIALAEYRAACQAWVGENAGDTDYTVVIDFDAWGGWSHAGVLNGIGWLVEMPEAYGMASVSMFQHAAFASRSDGTTGLEPAWLGYDAWAFRLNTYTDAYTRGSGGWFHQWLPFVGSDPIRVCSAFGGMCIYRTADYLAGIYDGRNDCEHTSFHRSIAERTGRSLYYNPSQRTVMRWLVEESADGGQHSHD